MKIRLPLTLCCVFILSGHVFAEGEGENKIGPFPFMAFIYYPDESVLEATGLRFLRGAVLVKPEWLITSSVGPVMIDKTPAGFPRKTLLARLGAVSIDGNFTLNEDEDEQEREVIQIVRPRNYSEAEWWRNDITLLKTLLPFNLTSAVGAATIRTRPGIISSTNCFMLVYAVTKKFGNWTEERMLMQLFVDLQPSSYESCGSHFNEETMLCATDSEETKNLVFDPQFCQGNSGGPLICDNEVTGLQTYIENKCKPPYVYQLLSAWDNFITCGIEDKCSEENCAHMCTLINKDEPEREEITTTTTEEPPIHLVSEDVTKQTEEITLPSYSPTESTTEEYETPTRVLNLTPVMEQTFTLATTMATETTTMTTVSTTTMPDTSQNYEMETVSWPKDKFPERTKNLEENEIKIERKTNVEAQMHDVTIKPRKSAAARNTYVPISLLVQFGLAYLIV